MKRYEEYKDSDIVGFHQIPYSWSLEKLKYIASCNDEVLPESTEIDRTINYVEIGDVDYVCGITKSTEYNFREAPSRARRITRPNDVIVSTVRTYLKAIAKVTTTDFIVSTGFAVIRPRHIDNDYMAYTLLAPPFIEEVMSRSVGVSYPAIKPSSLMDIKICVPPLTEQRSIASFLDAKTKPIDDIIAKREQQIALLEEMKLAIISRAVTKGLNPEAKMKDSGIEWIGEMPERWKLGKLKFFIQIRSGDSISISDISDEGNYNVYGGGEVLGHSNKYNVEDCILIGRVGARCGYLTDIQERAWATDNALILDTAMNKSYCFYLLKAFNLNSLNTSSAQPLITGTKVRNIIIPIVPSSEQAIASYLDTETTKIDVRIEKRRKQIALLQEYKHALITDAVTGKIDVRGFSS